MWLRRLGALASASIVVWQQPIAQLQRSDLQENVKGLFDGKLGFGNKAAVVVVDFVNAYVTPGHPLCCSPNEDFGVAVR